MMMNMPVDTAGQELEVRREDLRKVIEALRLKFPDHDFTFKGIQLEEVEVRTNAAKAVTEWLDTTGDAQTEDLLELIRKLLKCAMLHRFSHKNFVGSLEKLSEPKPWISEFRRCVTAFREGELSPPTTPAGREQLRGLLDAYYKQLDKLERADAKSTHPTNSRPLFSVFLAGANCQHLPDIKRDTLDLAAQLGLLKKPNTTTLVDEYLHWLVELQTFSKVLQAHFKEELAVRSHLPMYEVTAYLQGVKYLWKQSADEVVQLLLSRRKIILQGPPGTGKTYRAEEHVARGLAEDLREDDGNKAPAVVTRSEFEAKDRHTQESEPFVVTELVQFHASYDYEDFVRGYRARGGGEGALGFDLVDGPFARMATLAALYPESRFLLIIDEINRADIARVLGECIYVLDRPTPHECPDKSKGENLAFKSPKERLMIGGEHTVRPRYAPTRSAKTTDEMQVYPYLCFPENLYILGTMNTADRSLAIIDMALRRRFAFVDESPDWEVVSNQVKKRTELKKLLTKCKPIFDQLNDDLLIDQPGLQIGHAYFMSNAKDDKKAKREVLEKLQHQLVPLLREYIADGHFGSRREEVWAIIKTISELK